MLTAGCENIKASLTYPCYCFVVHLRSAFIYASGNLNSCILIHTYIHTHTHVHISVYIFKGLLACKHNFNQYTYVDTYTHFFMHVLLSNGRQIHQANILV